MDARSPSPRTSGLPAVTPAEPAGAAPVGAARRPDPVRRALRRLYQVRFSTVYVLVGLTVGLLMAGVQISALPVLAIFGVVWTATLLALIGITTRWTSHWWTRRRALR